MHIKSRNVNKFAKKNYINATPAYNMCKFGTYGKNRFVADNTNRFSGWMFQGILP